MKRYYLANEKSKQVLHAWFPLRKKAAYVESFATEDPYLYMLGTPLRCTKATPSKLDCAVKEADAQQVSYGTYMLNTYWGGRL